MKILNKFIWSKTEPKNKNDVWFDGSVFRLFKEEEWQAFTLPIDAAEKIAEVIKNASEVYQEKLEAGYGIVIEDNVISVIAPDWNTPSNKEGFIKNRTHYFNARTTISPFAWNIDNTSNPKKAIISLQKDYIYGIEYEDDTIHIKTDVTEDFTKSIYNRGSTYIFHKCLGGNNTLEVLLYGSSDLDTSFLKIYEASISGAFSLGNLKQLEEIFIPDTIARKSDLENITSELLVNVTYDELKSLRDTNKLKAGMLYRITDYITTTTQDYSKSKGHQFDIIVIALTENTLSEEAYAAIHEGDTYFTEAGANLAAWKIWYCLDNDPTRFLWAESESRCSVRMSERLDSDYQGWEGDIVPVYKVDNPYDMEDTKIAYYFESYNGDMFHFGLDGSVYNDDSTSFGNYSVVTGKGVIYRMIDEFGNDCPYDFKNIWFEKSVKADENVTWVPTFADDLSGNSSENVVRSQKEITGGPKSSYSLPFNSFGECCRNNFIDYDSTENSFGGWCWFCHIGRRSKGNFLGSDCWAVILGDEDQNCHVFDECSVVNIGSNNRGIYIYGMTTRLKTGHGCESLHFAEGGSDIEITSGAKAIVFDSYVENLSILSAGNYKSESITGSNKSIGLNSAGNVVKKNLFD